MKKLLLFISFLIIQNWSYGQTKYASNLICNLVQLQNDTVDIVLDTGSGMGYYYPNLKYKYVDSSLSYPAYSYTVLDSTLISVIDTNLKTYVSFCDSRLGSPSTITCPYFDAFLLSYPCFKLKSNTTTESYIHGTFTLKSKFKCTFDITYRLPAGLLVTDLNDNQINNSNKINYYNRILTFKTKNQDVTIISSDGVLFYNHSIDNNTLNVSNFKSGLYIVKSTTDGNYKFVVE